MELPTTAIATRALDFVSPLEHPSIRAHSLRTFLLARRAGLERGLTPGIDYDEVLLFVACVFHDLGTAERFDGAQRFEVEGADAAVTFLRDENVSASDADLVWEAIALHTSPGIAQRRGPICALTRQGVLIDFKSATGVAGGDVDAVEEAYPRASIEVVLGAAVVSQALANPAKAPASSWPGGLLRAHLAGPCPGINPNF